MTTIVRWTNGKFVASQPLQFKTAIVGYADNGYTHIADKLVQSVKRHNPNIDVLLFKHPSEIGSPSHAENPYAFKVYAIQRARDMGYTTIIWCDSCLRLIRPIEDFVTTVQTVGIYFQKDGWKCGEWANDRALEYFHRTRDEAMTISTIYACCMGFDFMKPQTHEFFARWKRACQDGIFRGAWKNDTKSESQDQRCKGHRHDQTCAELIAYDMGIPLQPIVFSYDTTNSNRYFTGWDKP